MWPFHNRQMLNDTPFDKSDLIIGMSFIIVQCSIWIGVVWLSRLPKLPSCLQNFFILFMLNTKYKQRQRALLKQECVVALKPEAIENAGFPCSAFGKSKELIEIEEHKAKNIEPVSLLETEMNKKKLLTRRARTLSAFNRKSAVSSKEPSRDSNLSGQNITSSKAVMLENSLSKNKKNCNIFKRSVTDMTGTLLHKPYDSGSKKLNPKAKMDFGVKRISTLAHNPRSSTLSQNPKSSTSLAHNPRSIKKDTILPNAENIKKCTTNISRNTSNVNQTTKKVNSDFATSCMPKRISKGPNVVSANKKGNGFASPIVAKNTRKVLPSANKNNNLGPKISDQINTTPTDMKIEDRSMPTTPVNIKIEGDSILETISEITESENIVKSQIEEILRACVQDCPAGLLQ